jgi:hypothetical protein
MGREERGRFNVVMSMREVMGTFNAIVDFFKSLFMP